jgi:Thiamine monophosphate synthase
MKKENFKLQFITNATMQYDTVMSAHIALEGGCKWIQLRMKDASLDEIRKAAIDISTLCRRYNATFIIDDHIGLVEEVGANGVHLGLNDMPIKEARKMLGKDYIIGGTANTFQDVRQHFINGADYIGCGPFRFTTTKKSISNPWTRRI